MPNALVKSFAQKTHLSVAKVESLWKRAVQIAKKEGHEEEYDYIVGILKKSLKMEELITYAKSMITEEKQLKEAELFLGRFQPLHKGHATVIGRMKNPVVALVKGGKTSSDQNKNPLSIKDQARLVKKAYPKAIILEVPNGYIPDIATSLADRGIKITAVWGGEDRRAGYERQLEAYDKKNPDAPLNIEFKPTFDGGKRIGGTSATLVRKAIRDGDEATFKKHMPKSLHSEWEFLRKKLS